MPSAFFGCTSIGLPQPWRPHRPLGKLAWSNHFVQAAQMHHESCACDGELAACSSSGVLGSSSSSRQNSAMARPVRGVAVLRVPLAARQHAKPAHDGARSSPPGVLIVDLLPVYVDVHD
jgi:hypothetical protein